MFQTTRRRLALWYTTVTAVLLILFASGFYVYVRSTLVERVDDTLNHVVEVVQRSLVIETEVATMADQAVSIGESVRRVNVEASFRDNTDAVEDDHIDLEWFSPRGDLLWSTFSQPTHIPVHLNPNGETVHSFNGEVLRQVTQQVQVGEQTLGYLRVSHPWFEVTKPIRQLIIDLCLWTALMVGGVAAIGWFLSGLAIAPVRDSYQRLKQFTADASHELRNPIAVIQTNVQVALADPDPQWQQQQLQVVERLTRRLGRLVEDLLFLARQDSNIVQLHTNPISLYALLLELVEEQQTIASEREVILSLHSPQSHHNHAIQSSTSPLYLLQGNRDQLIRLFTNLVSNAIRYTPANGRVTLALQQHRDQGRSYLEVQITDTGIGIPSDAIPHLFDRFYRIDPARSHATGEKQSPGSGLGLAIAKAIVDSHHGKISVTSQPEKGTTFTVLLPSLD